MSSDTRQQILLKSERLIRTRGYTGFSYADLAEHLGMTKASVHYHFPTKEDLLLAILNRCTSGCRENMAVIRLTEPSPAACLRAYARIYLGSIQDGLLTACAILAAERAALPPSVHPLLRSFFQLQLDWIASVLDEGRRDGTLNLPYPAQQTATVLFSAIEGGTVLGWGMERVCHVLTAFEAVMTIIEKPAAVGKQPRKPAARRRAVTRSAA